MDVLTGKEAESYTDTYLVRVNYTDGGWRQLWRCTNCGTYWEMTWEGGQGGFDYGITTLRKLSPQELPKRWPEMPSTP